MYCVTSTDAMIHVNIVAASTDAMIHVRTVAVEVAVFPILMCHKKISKLNVEI